MRRRDIEQLQGIQGFPALTITLPTYRTAPDVQQNAIRLKNLVHQAQTLLTEESANGKRAALLSRLNSVVEGLNESDFQDGLAIFVHADFAAAYPVPFTLPERVVVDETFVTRDAVQARLHQVRYLVVALSDNTRLFDGTNGTLTERTEGTFPVQYVDRSEDPSIPGARESGHESLIDEEQRYFFRQVDAALSEVLQEEELPVVVLGVTRNLAFFREVTANERAIAGTAEGNYDHASWSDVAGVAWKALQPYLSQQQSDLAQQWEDAVGAKLAYNSIAEIWEAAYDGRGNLLLVEEGYHVSGSVDDSGRVLTVTAEGEQAEGGSANGNRYDVVDDLIELVLSRGGRVRFMQPGNLPEGTHLGLTLRY